MGSVGILRDEWKGLISMYGWKRWAVALTLDVRGLCMRVLRPGYWEAVLYWRDPQERVLAIEDSIDEKQ